MIRDGIYMNDDTPTPALDVKEKGSGREDKGINRLSLETKRLYSVPWGKGEGA